MKSKRAVSVAALGTINMAERQAEAYEAVRRHPGKTARELEALVGQCGVWRRLSELEALGLLVAGEPRTCSVTGRPATPWRASDCPMYASPRRRRPTARELQLMLDAARASVEYLARRLQEESARRMAAESALAAHGSRRYLGDAPVWPRGGEA